MTTSNNGNKAMITANAVLISNSPIDLSQSGIDRVENDRAKKYLQDSNLSVIAAHINKSNYRDLLQLLNQEKSKNQNKRIIIFQENLSLDTLYEINNLVHPSFLVEFQDNLDFANYFEKAFNEYYELEQAKNLIELVNQNNNELKKLMLHLEEKIASRQIQLEESTKKNKSAEQKLFVLKKTLIQIYQATSLSEIEHGITEALKNEFKIQWVQIRNKSQTNLSQKKDDLKFYNVPLKFGKRDFGSLLFFKQKDENFSGPEKRFLSQVADAVSLSIERTFQYLKSQDLKTQWEATFDAISDPICLTDEEYNILRINSGFLKKTNTHDFKEHIGKKCYTSLFNRQMPCEGCQRGTQFQIRNPYQNKQSEVFEVYSQTLEQTDRTIHFQMYRDITQDLNLQRQVIESAKMAELGTISSSIAHELNNPIGGMLNFIQLMKMDLTGQEVYFPDILEIEKGIIKCKNIVKNLLGFSRKSFNKDISEVSLIEVIEQAIKITELKTRSIGIPIEFIKPSQDIVMNGRFNLLTHAVRNILQNSQESLIEKRKKDKSFLGKINIELFENAQSININISDNGDGINLEDKYRIFDPLYTTKDPETNSGLGLALALQIAEEHKGQINVSVGNDKKLTFNLRFFKSEGQSGPSAF
jgi:two-component system, NtrC family, sensor kinase